MEKTVILTTILLILLSTWLNPTPLHASPNKTPDNYPKSPAASPNTIWVPDNYTTIQTAINNAKEGDTIFIRAGTYPEHVTINKPLSLMGENKHNTTIDGSKTGIAVRVIDNNVAISNITIQNGEFGIWLQYSSNNILTDNIVTNNSYGIYLWGSSNNILTSNIASNRYDGIYLYRSGGNTISHNDFSNNWRGIYLDDSSYNTLIDNTVSSNTGDGIGLYHSSNNILSDNTASNNTYGIYIGDSDNNDLSDNNALHNQRGIYLYYSGNNILRENTIANNSQYGIFLDSSNNNQILHNNFINNTGSSPRSINSLNPWDNGIEGNYWSDYQGTDANQDGIGDTPYPVGENNQDNHPLMATFLQFNILMANKAYTINAISNSTISDFQCYSDLYNRTNTVSFRVNGAGFCRVSIPYSLIDPPFTVRVDDSPPLYFKKVYANGTHTWLYFTYDPPEHEVTITHRFPLEQLVLLQWTVFGLALITVILFSISINYYRLFNKQKKVIEAYEREVGSFPISHEERARMRFIKDVIEREEKLEKFKKKYGIKINPASTLEDLMEKLGVQKQS